MATVTEGRYWEQANYRGLFPWGATSTFTDIPKDYELLRYRRIA